MKNQPPIITRDKIQTVIPLQDCSGRKYTKDEREDMIRWMLFAAEIQRDRDVDYYNNLTTEEMMESKIKQIREVGARMKKVDAPIRPCTWEKPTKEGVIGIIQEFLVELEEKKEEG